MHNITTSPGAVIGSDSDIIQPRRAIDEWPEVPPHADILDSIRGLARAIRRDLGVPSGYSEHGRPERHGEAVTEVTVYAEIDGKPLLFQGSTHPMDGALCLPALREQLCRFITERKHQQEAA